MEEEKKKCQHESCILSALLATRNGFDFGFKFRFFNSIGEGFLLDSQISWKKLIISTIKKSIKHGIFLAAFTGISKYLICLLRKNKYTNDSQNYFIAGLITSFIIYKKFKSNLLNNILMYMYSNCLGALGFYIVRKKIIPNLKYRAFFAAIVWGISLFIFHDNFSTLDFGLQKSLKYLFVDSDKSFNENINLLPDEVSKFIEKVIII